MNVKRRLGVRWRLLGAQDAVEILRICPSLHLIGRNIVCGVQAFSHFRIVLFVDQKINVTQMSKARNWIIGIRQRDPFQEDGWGTLLVSGKSLRKCSLQWMF